MNIIYIFTRHAYAESTSICRKHTMQSHTHIHTHRLLSEDENVNSLHCSYREQRALLKLNFPQRRPFHGTQRTRMNPLRTWIRGWPFFTHINLAAENSGSLFRAWFGRVARNIAQTKVRCRCGERVRVCGINENICGFNFSGWLHSDCADTTYGFGGK